MLPKELFRQRLDEHVPVVNSIHPTYGGPGCAIHIYGTNLGTNAKAVVSVKVRRMMMDFVCQIHLSRN